MGGKKNAGSRAAAAENKFTQLGIDQLSPFTEAGAAQLPGLAAGATVGGLDERIAELLSSDTFGSLIGGRERAVQGQLAAGGLTRSGLGLQSAAAVPQELALQLEQMLTGRSQGLANTGLGAAGGVADLFRNQGEAVSSGIVTDAETSAAFGSNIANLAAGIFFSDERLKENVIEVANVDGLAVVEWDWIPQTKDTIIAGCPNIGFLAQDVKARYPEFVGEYAGWLFVDYENLMRKLQSNLDEKIAREAA